MEVAATIVAGLGDELRATRLQRPDPAAVRLEARAPGLIADLDEGHYFTT